MKNVVIAAVLAATVASPVFASSLEAGDVQMAFATESVQAVTLSGQEMKETEGALAPWIIGGIGGGVMGGAGYAYGYYNGNYNWSNSRFLGNVGTGVVIGATFGQAGALAGGGFSLGANVWRFNSFSLNQGVNTIWRR